MRLSSERIKCLQKLLKELYGLEYTDKQAQEAGIAIMRFVVAKSHCPAHISIKKEKKNE